MLFNFICSKFVESNKNIGECGYKNDISSKITYNTKVYEYPDLELGFGPIIKIKDNDDDNMTNYGLLVNYISLINVVRNLKPVYKIYLSSIFETELTINDNDNNNKININNCLKNNCVCDNCKCNSHIIDIN